MGQNHVIDLYQSPGYGFGLGFTVITNLADTKALGSVGRLSWAVRSRPSFLLILRKINGGLMTQIEPYSGFYGRKMPQFVYQAIID